MARRPTRRNPRIRILRCPMCGSSDVELAAGMITGARYYCRKCNYLGALILEEDVKEDGTPLR